MNYTEYTETKFIRLKLNTPLISFEHIKLYVRLPLSAEKMMKSVTFGQILLTYENTEKTYYCTALAQYSEQVEEGTLDMSADVYATLNLVNNAFVNVSPISVYNVCTKLYLECKTPADHKAQLILPYLLQKPVMKGIVLFNKKQRLTITNLKYTIEDTADLMAAVVSRYTELTFVAVDNEEGTVSFEEIGGLDTELEALKEMLELPIRYRTLFEKLHVKAPKGILLYGPPGTGKTMLAKAIANSINASFYVINGPSIATKYYGESENRLRNIFEKASQNTPAIVFIDEVDAIAGKRANMTEVDRRICTQLLVLMDGIQPTKKLMVIAATNLPDELDPAVRRGGRFDVELEVKVPDREGRKQILELMLKQIALTDDVDITKLSELTNGYVGADLAALVRQAGLITIKQHISEKTPLAVSQYALLTAMKRVRPSTLRELGTEKSDILLSSVIGLDAEIKQILKHLELPQKHRQLFKDRNISQTTGVLLYGAPGTGKTMLAKAIANHLTYNLVYIKGPELLSKYVGETERQIRKIFQRARMGAPAIILLDEMDSLTATRDAEILQHNQHSILSQFLAELSDIQTNNEIVIIGTTNRPDLLDPALIRAGRFDLKLDIKPPNEQALYNMLSYQMNLQKLHVEVSELKPIAKEMHLHNLTGVHVDSIVRETILAAIADMGSTPDDLNITLAHLKTAVKIVIEQVTTKYSNMKEKYASYY